MDIKILVAVHKKYWMPKDPVYMPLHVGKAGKEDLGFAGDDTGDNISAKNSSFCELTGLYWAWKNLQCDYIGLCHYRRYFVRGNVKNGHHILTGKEFEEILQNHDIIMPWKNLFSMNIREQYEDGHFIKDLELTQRIVQELYPEYETDFDEVLAKHNAYMYNMFVMKRELFEEYAKWLFAILFELEKRVDISAYDPYQSRIFGFLGERLLNVWIHHREKNLSIYHARVMYIDAYWRNARILSRRLLRKHKNKQALKYYLRYLFGKFTGLSMLEK